MISANRLNAQPALVLPVTATQVLSTFVASNLFAVSAYKSAFGRTPDACPREAPTASTVFPFSFFRWKGWL